MTLWICSFILYILKESLDILSPSCNLIAILVFKSVHYQEILSVFFEIKLLSLCHYNLFCLFVQYFAFLFLFNDLIFFPLNHEPFKLPYLAVLNCYILLLPSLGVNRASPNMIAVAILDKLCISGDLILIIKQFASKAAILEVLLDLPVLVGIVVIEITNLILTLRPQCSIVGIIFNLKGPLRSIDSYFLLF